jgi:type III restriction enzyme
MYDTQPAHVGPWRPRKHFLTRVPKFDGQPGGEEEQCARALDGLAEVRHWVRNVARHPGSFRLPLAGGFFYPDFVAVLHDGRLLVVEYKGALTAQLHDTAEKRAVGLLWERAGGGLFVIVEHPDEAGRDMLSQLEAKLAE